MPPRHTALVPLALGLVLLSGPALAQPEIDVRRLGPEDGFFGYDVRAIHQDRDGILWFATRAGLLSWNGHEVGGFGFPGPETSSGLNPDHVNDVTEDPEGTLWIGSSSGLYVLDSLRTAIREAPGGSRLSGPVESVAFCMGTVWAGTRGRSLLELPAVGGGHSIVRVDPRTGDRTALRHDPDVAGSAPGGSIADLLCDAADRLWVVSGSVPGMGPEPVGADETAGTLSRLDLPDGPFIHFVHDPDDPRSLAGALVFDVEAGDGGSVWVGTSGGIDLVESGTIRHLGRVPGADERSPVRLARASDGTLWLATQTTTLRLEEDRFQPVGQEDRSLGTIGAIAADRNGGMWTGHFTGGAVRIGSPGFRFVATRLPDYRGRPVPSPFVTGFAESPDGDLYVSTLGQGIVRMSDGTWFRHDPGNPRSLRSDDVRYLLMDSGGTLWVSTDGGVDRMDLARPGVFHHLPIEIPNAAGDVNAGFLYEDAALCVWISYPARGVERRCPGTGSVDWFPLPPGARGTVAAMYEDGDGGFWMGGVRGGLAHAHPSTGEVTRYRNDPADTLSLGSPNVVGIAPDPDDPGTLWIATMGGGLNRFDKATGSFDHLTRANGRLPMDHLSGLQVAADGSLWMPGPAGIVRFDPRSHAATLFTPADGLLDTWFFGINDGHLRDGTLLFGEASGFVSVNPLDFRRNLAPTQVHITGVHVGGIPLKGSGTAGTRAILPSRIDLDHDRNDLGIDWVGVRYDDPDRIGYRTRLGGPDASWRDAGTGRSASFPALAPGEYVFEVQATNPDGSWSPKTARVLFLVNPPWWRSSWGLLLLGLAAAGLAVVGGAWQRARIREQESRRVRLLETELRASVAEEQARSLETLDRARSSFFANISHEFRTPLTLLLGPLQDARRGETLDTVAPVMLRNAERLNQLIGQLHDLAKLEAGLLHLHAAETDIVAFLRLWVSSFRSKAERDGIGLTFEAQDGVAPVWVDRDKLEAVVVNLLSNALKFTPRGGTVRIAVQSDASTCTITVQDTGRGITPDDLPRVFDRYFRGGDDSLPAVEGTGIGLALAREIVILHQGTLSARSTPSVGSTFEIRLPLGRDHLEDDEIVEAPTRPVADMMSADIEEETAVPDADPGPDAPAILVVEDNDDMREYVAGCLRTEYRVRTASSGDQGLVAVRDAPPDLVISDVMMPGLSGYGLCRAIREDPQLAHLPVILLTALDDDANRLEGLGTGADDYLAKPFNRQELLLRAEHLVRVRRLLRERYEGRFRVETTGAVVGSEDAEWLERARTAAEEHLGDALLTVEWLADQMAVSPRQLRRRLGDLTGLSPRGFIQTLRLDRAARLLEQGRGSVQAVAAEVGYDSAEHFARVFRQAFGVAPSHYPAEKG